MLLVEDEPLIRDVLLEALMARDYEVVAAPTCEDALRLLAEGLRPPVLVTDVNLGSGCSGIDLADEVRQFNFELAIVFMTGLVDMLRAIRDLASCDAVLTISGEARRIKWIGQRAYAPPFARRNPGVWPVTIRAGALADGAPSRDLHVSPNHALFLAAVLVEARLLVNGATITHAPPQGGVEYLNLELAPTT